MRTITLPDFQEEQIVWKKGYSLVIGVDEVGRGAFAGPVVVGAVAFPNVSKVPKGAPSDTFGTFPTFDTLENMGINDSKLLTPRLREKLAPEIKKYCLSYGIGEVGVATINKIGIGKATERAMRLAIANLNSNIKARSTKQIQNSNEPNSKSFEFRDSLAERAHFGFLKTFVLSDAFHIAYLRGIGLKNQKAIVKGDQKSISIAAASIIAKVYRDSLMHKLSLRHGQYSWAVNKGYGTKMHQQAIVRYGLTSFHRTQFVSTFLSR